MGIACRYMDIWIAGYMAIRVSGYLDMRTYRYMNTVHINQSSETSTTKEEVLYALALRHF